jgi:hypothetical protein
MRMFLALLLLAAACAEVPGDDERGGVFQLNSAAPKRVQHIPYGGGVVLHQPREVHLYWGAWFNTAGGKHEVQVLDAFARRAGGTNWFGVTGQYTDGEGSVRNASIEGGSIVVTSPAPGDAVTDADLMALVQAQINKGALRWDPQAVYFVFTPPNTLVHGGKRGGGTSCKDLCGYHQHASLSLHGVGLADVKYGAIPHGDCPDGCTVRGVNVNGPALDQETITLSHEIAEAATDPDLDAWTTHHGDNELGDLCNGGFAADWSGEKFAVQDLWSNKDRRCVSGY